VKLPVTGIDPSVPDASQVPVEQLPEETLGEVGMPPPYPPGDFAAWFEAFLGGQW
jgi:hypothetical protein